MNRCFELAQLGAGSVAPNPMVGSVIVHNEQIIGEGYHQKFGQAHAEVNAVNSVSNQDLLNESTIYVSLEPCAHHGKTPPCADLIVSKRFKRAVIACQDPFAKVNGAGIDILKLAGIDVTVGVLEKQALNLNKRFITFHEKKRPYIILKWAETADGFVDTHRESNQEPSLKITSEPSNILVHKWRAEEAAIMVGKQTALLDNPSLTTRKYGGNNPRRILMDTNSEVPNSNSIFSDNAETIRLTAETIANTRNIRSVLDFLYQQAIQSIIVEGGPTLHRSFYESGHWDEIRRFISPIKVKEGVSALKIDREADEEIILDKDELLTYTNR